MSKQKEKIKIPRQLLEDLITSKRNWAESLNRLEDYLISNDPNLLEEIEEGLKDIEEGNTEDFNEVAAELNL